ncbi:MAG TPA: PIN/TRAM domain-containing protein [Clostridia bacterium]|jgi:uncharacterized protein YacL|nr:PIN/TRAM domain-containing protein [Clostridia bacterium]
MLNKLITLVITIIGAALGYEIVDYFLPIFTTLTKIEFTDSLLMVIKGLGILIGAFIGFVITPKVKKIGLSISSWIESFLQKTPIQDLFFGVIGLIIGLIIANLLSAPFYHIRVLGVVLPIVSSLVLGYFGAVVAVKKRNDLPNLFNSLPRLIDKNPTILKDKTKLEGKAQCKILDTSVIIDGRIADICESGFIEGTLVIPSFVLEELRHIADSSDLLKRNRGRRGLDILNRIQKESKVKVQIYEKDFEDIAEVDSKLVRLAKMLDGKVVTNDYNLNKVAEFQGVPVLNINELANAVKPVVLPGEEMVVHVIKDGKESGQGVAYLDDGTMIVVDGGKKYIGETIDVMVTSVLQTAAGRMIFAKPKSL